MTEKISLRLVRTHDAEMICDQDGRPLGHVLGYTYSLYEPGDDPTLEIKVRVLRAEWDESLGVEISRPTGNPTESLPVGCDHPKEMFQFDGMVCGNCGTIVRQQRENG